MKLYGLLTNRLMERMGQNIPEVGMGATTLMWSDRYPHTIVELSNKVNKHGLPTWIKVQEDKATIINGVSIMEDPEYEYTRDLEAPIKTFAWNETTKAYREATQTLTENGYVYGTTSKKDATPLLIGKRDKYFDPSF